MRRIRTDTEPRAARPPRFPTGIVLVILVFSLLKAVLIGRRISPDFGPAYVLLLVPDLITLGAIVVLLTIGLIGHRLAAYIVFPLAWLLALYQLIDIHATIVLGQRARLTEIPKFLREAPEVIHTLTPLQWLAILVSGVCAWRIREDTSERHVRRIGVLGSVLACGAFVPAHFPLALERYQRTALLQLTDPIREAFAPTYSEREGLSAYAKLSERIHFPPVEGNPNIILVLLEGYSAAYSSRISGIHNFTPAFDELTREGSVFDNFYANDSNSEGGLVSLLSGTVPLSVIGGGSATHVEYSVQPAGIRDYKDRGYILEFLASTPADFASKKTYLKGVGFETIRGRDEVPRYKEAPRFVFKSPADGLLYEEAFDRVQNLMSAKRPFVLVLVTGTTHQPYMDPLGRAWTAENVFSYATAELRAFHERLKTANFYESGLLIAGGDHHDMTPVTEKEILRYGESAPAKVPLVILGRGVPRDFVDHRLFQQSDLFRLLPTALRDRTAPLSSTTFYVERDGGGLYPTAARVRVFDSEGGGLKGGLVAIHGSQLTWITEPRKGGAELLSRLHEQRAAAQWRRRSKLGKCLYRPPQLGVPSDEQGVLVEVFSGTNINDSLSSSSGRLVSSVRLPRFNEQDVLALLPSENAIVQVSGYLRADIPGNYFFTLEVRSGACLSIDDQFVVDGNSEGFGNLFDGSINLTSGLHPFVLRYAPKGGVKKLRLGWYPPGVNASRLAIPPFDGTKLVLAR